MKLEEIRKEIEKIDDPQTLKTLLVIMIGILGWLEELVVEVLKGKDKV